MNRLTSLRLLLLVPWAVSGSAETPDRAAVASAHPLASEAGIEVLGQGGNAFDAAVAVSAALGVVEPYGSGLGGGGFFLLHRAADGFDVVVDGREVAPGAATEDMYLDANGEPVPGASRNGPLAAGIPGLPAALVHMAENYGRLPLAESLAPAIRYAEEGYPAYASLVRRLSRRAPTMTGGARDVFVPGGDLPAEGELFRQPDLGATMQAMARDGHDGFYRGPVARMLVDGVQQDEGIWSIEDLENYRAVEREPLVGSYRDTTIVTAPPPSAGGVAIINMFNMLSGFDLETADNVTRTHVLTEVMRRAYRDRGPYLGDPDFVDIPLDVLLHPYYAAGQRASLRIDRATPSDSLPGIQPIVTAGGGNQTSHFSVIDVDGNIVAATQSINFGFGSGYIAPGTGVLLNNEMDDFSMKPGQPNGYQLLSAAANKIEPGKRMLSSMTPTILHTDDGAAILGTPGGSQIITIVFLASLAWIEGADATTMANNPRFHHQYFPDELMFEPDLLTEEEQAALEGLGHNLERSRQLRGNGNLQIVTWDRRRGTVDAASDPRGLGEPRFSAP